MDEKIVLTDESGETITLYAVEETRVAGVNYLLAADPAIFCVIFLRRRIWMRSMRWWRMRTSWTISAIFLRNWSRTSTWNTKRFIIVRK